MFHLSGQKHLTNVPKITCPATATAKIIINTNITPKTSIHKETSSCIWGIILSSYMGITRSHCRSLWTKQKSHGKSIRLFWTLLIVCLLEHFFAARLFSESKQKIYLFRAFPWQELFDTTWCMRRRASWHKMSKFWASSGHQTLTSFVSHTAHGTKYSRPRLEWIPFKTCKPEPSTDLPSLKLTTKSPLKIDGWKTSLFFWGLGLFFRRYVRFRKGI